MEKFSPKKTEQVVTTIRMPKELLDDVEEQLKKFNLSRNEFINQCIRYALQNMEDAE